MKKKRSTGIILSYINTFLNMICGLFLSSFLLRQLGDTNYGVYQTMASFANYLVLLEFGTGTVMARNLSACRAKGVAQLEIEKNISTIWSITNILALVILVVSGLFYVLIDSIYSASMSIEEIALGKNIFGFIIIFMISSFYLQTLNGITLSHEHYTYSSIVSIVRISLRTIFLIFLVLGYKNAIVIPIVDAFVSLGIVIFTYFYCKRNFKININFKNFDKVILKAALPLCTAMFLQVIVNQSNNIVGKFILGVMSGPEDVALYSVGLYVYSIFSSLSTIPVSLYVPQVTKNVVSGMQGLQLTKTLVQPCRLIVLISGVVMFGFGACGRQFVEIVYGQEYLLSWSIAEILMVPMFLNMSNALTLNVLDAMNKRIVRSYILMITTAINIVMTILGIRYFGIIAAAVATGIATLLQTIIMNIYYHKVIGIKVIYLFKNIFKGIIIYQLIGLIIGYIAGSLVTNIYLSFIISGLIYVVIALGGFILFGKNEKEKEILKRIAKK